MSLNLYFSGYQPDDCADVSQYDTDDVLCTISSNQLAAVGYGNNLRDALLVAVGQLRDLGVQLTEEQIGEFVRGSARPSQCAPTGYEYYAIVEYYHDRDNWGQE